MRALASLLLVASGLALAFAAGYEATGMAATGVGIALASAPIADASQAVWRRRARDPGGGTLLRRVVAGYLAFVGSALAVAGLAILAF